MIGVLLPKLGDHEYRRLRAAIAAQSSMAGLPTAAKATFAKMRRAIATRAT
jgi:hypothetical protein